MSYQYSSSQDSQSQQKSDSETLLKPKSIKSIRFTWHRWIALAFSCLITLGFYMCYDFPQNLSTQIQQKDGGLGISETDVNLFYSVYSFPNILLPFISGYLIDIIGIRKCLFLFPLILIIGQAICTIGVEESIKLYYVVVAGRGVFALGGESLTVCQNTIVSKWFKGKSLSFALAFVSTIASVGSILSSFIFPATYHIYNQLFLPLLVGTMACIFSLGCGICLILMDRYADKQEGRKEQAELSDQDKIKVKDIKNLKGNFWWICISFTLTSVCFLQFMQTLQDYLIKQFGIHESLASNYISIPYFIKGGLTPLIGILVDKFGKRGKIIFGSSILLILSHILMIIVPQCGSSNDTECVSYWFILPLALIGIFISIYGAIIFACIPLVCDSKVIGTAFGIITCIQNLGLTVGPLVTGKIIQDTTKDNGYFWDQIFFISLSSVCFGVNIIIYLKDIKMGNLLDKTNNNQIQEDEIQLDSENHTSKNEFPS